MNKNLLLLFALLLSGIANASDFVLDGYFNDWEKCKSVFTDSRNESDDVDFVSMSFRSDSDWLYIKLVLDKPVVLNENNNIYLEIDTDNNPLTGYRVSGIGAEMGWNFGARYGYYNLTEKARTLTHKNIELYALPTHASREFEIAIGRKVLPDGTTPLFNSDTIHVLFWNRKDGGDLMPDGGTVFHYVMKPCPVVKSELTNLKRADSTDLRVMTYNTFINGISDPERMPAFERIFKATNPDLITLNECWKVKPETVQSLLNLWLPLPEKQSWQVAKTDEGNITCSRYPILDSENVYKDHRISAVLVQTNNSPTGEIMVINCHFTCCHADNVRQEEADALIAFLRELYKGKKKMKIKPGTPFFLAGDLNLVGKEQQLLTLLHGDIANQKKFGKNFQPDNGKAPLTDLVSEVIGRRMAYTWRDPEKTFSPSRLDYILYPASKIQIRKAFTLQTEILPENWLLDQNLKANDTRQASDHLPRVADFRFVKQ